MYAWIWRRLPFGLPGKIIGSLLLSCAVAATLWFWGFPKAEPLLPFDDANVSGAEQVVPSTSGSGGAQSPAAERAVPSTRTAGRPPSIRPTSVRPTPSRTR
jgi:hypothetical protein